MTADKPFDFERYLKALDPKQTYYIEELTGGAWNVLARAIKHGPPQQSRFPS